MIKVEELSFSYGKKEILRNINCTFKEGKITTILGGNGCGKSTLFHLITKNLKPNSGVVKLQGKDVTKMKLKDYAKKVAIVHQNNTAPDDITVEKLVRLGRITHSKHCKNTSEEDEKKVQWALEVTNLYELKDCYVSELSGGQRQRAWIAMSLAQDTKVLLLDEPTTYLDVYYQIELMNLVKKLSEDYKMTIIMILHDINQALYYSDELIAINEGKVIVQGSPNDVMTKENIASIFGLELQVLEINQKKLVLTV